MLVYSLSSVIIFRKKHVPKLAPCTCPQGFGQSPRMQPWAEEMFAEPYTGESSGPSKSSWACWDPLPLLSEAFASWKTKSGVIRGCEIKPLLPPQYLVPAQYLAAPPGSQPRYLESDLRTTIALKCQCSAVIADSIQPGNISNLSRNFKDLLKPSLFLVNHLKGAQPRSDVEASSPALKHQGWLLPCPAPCIPLSPWEGLE